MSSGERSRGRATALTARQRQALDVIRASLREHGMAPTYVELAEAMGLANVSAVGGYLAALSRKGWIEVRPSVQRGIRLLREGAPILDAAHLAGVAAGGAGAVEEGRHLPRLHDFESFSREFEARPDFFVRIEGGALERAGFASGDLVAVRSRGDARDGDLVLARIGAGVTLRRFRRTDAGAAELRAVRSEAGHEPVGIGPATADAEIVGVVVGAIVGTRRGAG